MKMGQGGRDQDAADELDNYGSINESSAIAPKLWEALAGKASVRGTKEQVQPLLVDSFSFSPVPA